MFFGYADESGEPGVAKSDHDYFVFCIILFKNREAALKASSLVDEFRRENNFSETHEFHYATDSKKTRAAFIKLIGKLDFSFISVSMKKNASKNSVTYSKMARLVLMELNENNINANICIDVNPLLYAQLRKQKKDFPNELHFSEKISRGNNLIQVADYVTALKARLIKYPEKSSVKKSYSMIEIKEYARK